MKSKEQKRIEAEERQKRYDRLTDSEKIDLVRSRRGNSERELNRLWKKLFK